MEHDEILRCGLRERKQNRFCYRWKSCMTNLNVVQTRMPLTKERFTVHSHPHPHPTADLWVEVVVDNFGSARFNPVRCSLRVEKHRRVTLGEKVQVLKVGTRDGKLHFGANSIAGRRERRLSHNYWGIVMLRFKYSLTIFKYDRKLESHVINRSSGTV